MYLIRLVYASTASKAFNHEDIEKILQVAKENNGKHNVTGMLAFHRKYFLQCLEGSRTNVNNIYHQIANDPRHARLAILSYEEIMEREFSNWSMGYLPESSLTAPINLKFSGNDQFNPYEMTGESAHRMMLELRDTIPNY